ncbi:MAG TPA: hypothetical protein VE359_20375 [Vicinamibacteria bacterium]|nr:hypothetical protein [Vicinamibacteria bacterium]
MEGDVFETLGEVMPRPDLVFYDLFSGRTAMLGAGFLVATGRTTDDKPQSTIAFTPLALDRGKARRHDLLGADWLVRWERSGARYPSDLPEADREAFEEAIRRHEQFRPTRGAARAPGARSRRGSAPSDPPRR